MDKNLSEYCSELNLTKLKELATEWADMYPAIEEILLFKERRLQGRDSYSKHILVAIEPNFPDEKLKKIRKDAEEERENLREQAKKITQKQMLEEMENIKRRKEEKLERFSEEERMAIVAREWSETDCSHIERELIEVYKDKTPSDIIGRWMWLDISNFKIEETDIGDIIKQESKIVLYKKFHAEQTSAEERPSQEERETSKYLFKKTGPGWAIVFDGKEIAPLNQIGFAYFHYCIKNHPKEFTNLELEQAVRGKTGVPVEAKDLPVDPEYDEDSKKQFPGYQVGSTTMIKTRQDLSDDKTIKKALQEVEDLKERISEAERNNDKGIDILKGKLADIERYLSECTWQGRLKSFIDQETRVSGRVNKAMARALDSLLVHSDEAYSHFKESFGEIYSSTKRYRPTKPVSWVLE